MLRYLTAGESHGESLVVILEGLPSGLPLRVEEVQAELARRRLGYGRGPRMRFEQDVVTLLGGVRHGRTLGSPVAIKIDNTEWPKWQEEMSPAPGRTEHPLTQPRPGHADLAGMQKHGFTDARDVLERASARETAARVAAGTCAKALLANIGVDVISHVVQMGPVVSKCATHPVPADLERIDASPLRCFDPDAEAAMLEEVKATAKAGDSLGGVAEVLAYGVPVGLGSHAQWDRRLDALLGQALMSIQAVKGVEIRRTDRAGGVEGGMSNGSLLVARAAMKPLATLNRPTLKTVDVVTKQESVSFKERTDVTAVPAMGVVAETMVALVLAGEALRKFGGDSIAELARNHRAFCADLAEGDVGGTIG